MEQINNEENLKYYIKKYGINNIFQSNTLDYMKLYSFNKNEHICKANEKMNYFYFLVEGKAKVYILLANGKSLLLRFYNPLDIIGDMEFIDSNIYNCNVQVVKECLCIGISLDDLRKYALNDPIFLKYMCKSLSEKLASSSLSSSINLLYPLENRLASYILAVSPEENEYPLDGIVADNLIEIAEILGTSYRHLIRVINKFYKEKIIKKQNNLLIVLNRDVLKRLAGDLYE
ncbi:transcriptional regulator YeiL [Clostridium sp. Marseille-Q7071]